ncbi:MAG: hypothetical protein COV35_08270 [Alphaproteobacteria bacterium CG11_big_fil_rev_8_21_14_0_20_39_49]|nr:MAG: hypothetical protein COV35_08270 [Alphaproteobacteria bacterium CG11_big_fil_rev_8_21_14_0_20_39_49]
MLIKKSNGFSLVELSIVIVVVAIITAGIISSNIIVEQAKIRTQISELEKYKLAYEAFKYRFNAIPGDFKDASKYWGAAVPNGNGNSAIGDISGFNSIDNLHCVNNNEDLIFFYHLYLAGLIDRKYEPIPQIDIGYPSLITAPKKGMGASGGLPGGVFGGDNYTVEFQNSATIRARVALNLHAGNLHNMPHCHDFNDDVGTGTPALYHAIDTKIDDGIPLEGSFLAYRAWSSNYGNCLTAANGEYLLSNERTACHAMYIFEIY